MTSNDPDEPRIIVPVDLVVTGVPDVAVSADALNFGTLFLGLSRSDTVRVRNLGTDTLRVSGFAVDDGDYSVTGVGAIHPNIGPGRFIDLASISYLFTLVSEECRHRTPGSSVSSPPSCAPG